MTLNCFAYLRTVPRPGPLDNLLLGVAGSRQERGPPASLKSHRALCAKLEMCGVTRLRARTAFRSGGQAGPVGALSEGAKWRFSVARVVRSKLSFQVV